ncbi:MAG: murein L,D-transpeptidase catalytic domain family protein [Candidatus Pseudobacter hemicellulosilyticus]|uniref:Murein L,D-transpeptidase catalytic domain family protein n=1 Tax=Candidatus Pseudobacter hemicellulosilyticus TaxID=3121375 RepID=A0AAJ6BFB1_9BACT|nr:MAG: murein L,D-transpeptidase catalytic domain family protein [Pseudobacter sp.]
MQKPIKLRLGKSLRFGLLVVIVCFQWSFSTSFSVSPLYLPVPGAVANDAPPDADPDPVHTGNFHKMAWSLAKMAVYDSLGLEDLGLSRSVFQMALRGMEKLQHTGLVKTSILSIVDFSKPSSQKRLFIIDLESYQLLFNTLVAHGMASGKEMASIFSNKSGSHKSSLGFYVTGQTYQGSNGYSLKLSGVEKGINDYAMRRAIVMHGADYVSESWVDMQGYIGRSQGCPAVPPELSRPIIDEIKDGSCLFIYHPNSSYRTRSRLIR